MLIEQLKSILDEFKNDSKIVLSVYSDNKDLGLVSNKTYINTPYYNDETNELFLLGYKGSSYHELEKECFDVGKFKCFIQDIDPKTFLNAVLVINNCNDIIITKTYSIWSIFKNENTLEIESYNEIDLINKTYTFPDYEQTQRWIIDV